MTMLKPLSEQGFTLIELVIVMVLISILAVASMQPLLQGLNAHARVANNLDAIDGLRYTLERMVRELRQTRFDANGSGLQIKALDAPVNSGNISNGLCLQRSGGVDGSTLAALSLRKSGSTVTLDAGLTYPACSAAQPQTLVGNVTDLRFDYWTYGSGTTPLALAVNDANFGRLLNYIDITLTMTPAGSDSVPVAQHTRVVLRNGAWGAAK